MTIQGETKVDLKDFLNQMRRNGHREETIAFVEKAAGQEFGADHFASLYKAHVKTRAQPSKGRGLYRYLASCGVIRINEQ